MLLVVRLLRPSLLSHSVCAVDLDGEVATVRSLMTKDCPVALTLTTAASKSSICPPGSVGPTAVMLKVGVTLPVIWPLLPTWMDLKRSKSTRRPTGADELTTSGVASGTVMVLVERTAASVWMVGADPA